MNEWEFSRQLDILRGRLRKYIHDDFPREVISIAVRKTRTLNHNLSKSGLDGLSSEEQEDILDEHEDLIYDLEDLLESRYKSWFP
jgi:hypothetical protein